jgi:hypothetical protein
MFIYLSTACLTFLNMRGFGREWLLVVSRVTIWRITHCQLSTAAYLTYVADLSTSWFPLCSLLVWNFPAKFIYLIIHSSLAFHTSLSSNPHLYYKLNTIKSSVVQFNNELLISVIYPSFQDAEGWRDWSCHLYFSWSWTSPSWLP